MFNMSPKIQSKQMTQQQQQSPQNESVNVIASVNSGTKEQSSPKTTHPVKQHSKSPEASKPTNDLKVKYMNKKSTSLSSFRFINMLGVGSYSKVMLARRISTGKLYAIKKLRKSGDNVNKTHVWIERDILSEYPHPFIVKLYSAFQTNNELYLVLQYCPGGDLFQLIMKGRVRKEWYDWGLGAVRLIGTQQYLSPQMFSIANIQSHACATAAGTMSSKQTPLIQYSLSSQCINNNDVKDQSQTNSSNANNNNNNSGNKVNSAHNRPQFDPCRDWWSLGILIFELGCGFSPFYRKDDTFQQLKRRIIEEEPPIQQLGDDKNLKSLVLGLLNKNTATRLGSQRGVAELKQHPFFHGYIDWKLLEKEQHERPSVPLIVEGSVLPKSKESGVIEPSPTTVQFNSQVVVAEGLEFSPPEQSLLESLEQKTISSSQYQSIKTIKQIDNSPSVAGPIVEIFSPANYEGYGQFSLSWKSDSTSMGAGAEDQMACSMTISIEESVD